MNLMKIQDEVMKSSCKKHQMGKTSKIMDKNRKERSQKNMDEDVYDRLYG